VFLLGRSFIHPLFDSFLIGGGLSLVFAALLVWRGGSLGASVLQVSLPMLLLLNNSAHFAASTVRLYTKPRTFVELPFLTLGFPLVTVVVLTIAIVFAGTAGRHLQSLYLTWSPYHYAAQAYGLAVMYCYRSGCQLTTTDRRTLRLACLAPFLFAFLNARTVGLDWLVPSSILSQPLVDQARASLVQIFKLLSFALPVALLLRPLFTRKGPIPLISLLVIMANGVWWITLVYLDAFVWATIFHGLQYLCIVGIFYVKDRLQSPTNNKGWLEHTLRFYLACVVLGYFLFQVWPYAYVAAGFGYAESMLLVTAVVNIHHFVVDAYIWRLRRDPNYRIVTDAVLAHV
jgi:hypothetical protein